MLKNKNVIQLDCFYQIFLQFPPIKQYTAVAHLTRHFFVRHTLSEMENFKFRFYVAY